MRFIVLAVIALLGGSFPFSSAEAQTRGASMSVYCHSDLGEFITKVPLYRLGTTRAFAPKEFDEILLATLGNRYRFYGRFVFEASTPALIGIQDATIAVEDSRSVSTDPFSTRGGGVSRWTTSRITLFAPRNNRFRISLQGIYADGINCEVLPLLPDA